MEGRGVPPRHSHSIVVNELLRKVIHHAFDAAANAFRAIRLSRTKLAPNLVALALRTFNGSYQSVFAQPECGEADEQENSQARALEILGAAGFVLPGALLPSRGESRPASVEERLSGVEASIGGFSVGGRGGRGCSGEKVVERRDGAKSGFR